MAAARNNVATAMRVGAKPQVHVGRSQSTLVGSATNGKTQPWKAFWPPKADEYTAAEKEQMPWLTWKYDPKKAGDKPWHQWVSGNQSIVALRGST